MNSKIPTLFSSDIRSEVLLRPPPPPPPRSTILVYDVCSLKIYKVNQCFQKMNKTVMEGSFHQSDESLFSHGTTLNAESDVCVRWGTWWWSEASEKRMNGLFTI